VPLVIFLCFFAWGSLLYYKMEEPPDDAIPVYVVAKQWMWKLEHLDGRREINQLHVPVGRDIKLVMASEDVIHSFFVPAFRVKQDIVPGRYMTLWFKPTRTGAYLLECAEYCGTDHSRMVGTIYVLSDADYGRWLRAGSVPASMATQGRQLFQHFGCSGCHGPASTVHAPDLNGVFGSLVHLQNGKTKLADEEYIHDSVIQPSKDIVAGFADKMPSFKGQISETQLLQIIAYIKSLSSPTGGQP
jgi:cytochrome c oxidase subunit 2